MYIYDKYKRQQQHQQANIYKKLFLEYKLYICGCDRYDVRIEPHRKHCDIIDQQYRHLYNKTGHQPKRQYSIQHLNFNPNKHLDNNNNINDINKNNEYESKETGTDYELNDEIIQTLNNNRFTHRKRQM